MIDKDALQLFGKHLKTTLPVEPLAPLPSDLLRWVRALQDGGKAAPTPQSPTGHLRRAA